MGCSSWFVYGKPWPCRDDPNHGVLYSFHWTRSGKYRTTIQRSLSAIRLLMSTCRIRACFASNNDSQHMLPKIGWIDVRKTWGCSIDIAFFCRFPYNGLLSHWASVYSSIHWLTGHCFLLEMVLLLEGLWQSAFLAHWPHDRLTASTHTSDSAGTASWMSGCGFEVFAWFLYAGSFNTWNGTWQCVKTLYPCSSHQNSW